MHSLNPSTTQKNKRVLVIDDNPEIHADFRKVLGVTRDPDASHLDSAEAALFGDDTDAVPAGAIDLEDFEIDSAYQGQEGLKMVEAALAEGRPYAMAFVDVRMPPGWDGVETITQIWEKYPELQVVICTAYSDYSWTEITAKLGFSENLVILKKPFDNIEALQLAHALTKKWLVTRQAGIRMEDLDRLVLQRTEDLEAANERFSKAFKSSPLAMGICQISDARYLDMNESFLKLLELDHATACGRADHELGIWADPADADQFWQIVRQGNRVREMKCRVRTRTGAIREALAFGEELVLNQERCLLVLFHDMTEQSRLESQLRQSQKMEAVGQLASGVAHDFNNLLTIIRGHAEMRIGATDLDLELADSLKQISRATERAASLTRQLLSFSSRHMTRPRSIDLNQLIHDTHDMARSLIGELIEFHCELAAPLPPVHADPSNLEQVLVNLVVNARDAMPQGGHLTVRTAVVEVDSQAASLNPDARIGSFVCLSVEDTGCGMDTQILSRIFEPFYTTKPVGKGTGMGLAMVYGIVKQHQGWIQVASRVGHGTSFKIFLPISSEQVSTPGENPGAGSATGGHETILVVEDETAVRATVAAALSAAGYHVLQSRSGVDALKAWFAEDEKIDLLFTDLVMPEGMNGRKLAEKLRSRKPDIGIILTSGHALEQKEKAEGLSDAMFIAKPYLPSEIVAAVRACLDRQPAKN